MEYNLKITFGGKTHFGFIEPNGDDTICTKEKLVESSNFSDLTEYVESYGGIEEMGEMTEDDLETWTTRIYDLFKDAMSVRIEFIEPINLFEK